jgi:2-amino-4-hydroxy-6-hydroxymethyldihydropteridine diphosphokinase
MTASPVVLALGSNLGDRAGNLRAAIRLLEAQGVRTAAASSVWQTPPVPAGQPPFLNAAILVETQLTPPELLAAAKRVEHALGRRPGRTWGPRPADIDVLLYGGQRIATPALTVPHPRIAERAFVLVPLSEIVPGPLPLLGATALELLAHLPREAIVRTTDSLAPR